MLYYRIRNAIFVRLFKFFFAHRFKGYGVRTSLVFPIGIEGPENIVLGDDVYVGFNAYLAAKALTGGQSCLLEIGSGTKIGRFNHIYATRRIIIGSKVLTANGVYISDNQHGYQDPKIPIVDQPVVQCGSVEIGDGSWLGHNVCVLGVRIGSHCVIGANAVVTRDIPAYCVAAGAPAVILRRYDPISNVWRKTNISGEYY